VAFDGEGLLPAVQRFVDRDWNLELRVLATTLNISAGALPGASATAAAEERLEEIAESAAAISRSAEIESAALAKGFLTGKYRSKADLGQSARGEDVGDYLTPRGMRMLDVLDDVARRNKAKPAEVALAWVMAQPGITAPISSATSVDQVQSLIRAASLDLAASDLALLDETGP
jgi:aryl-alcohol dehydrogenase-like predicted oxidoreductase